MYNKVLVPLDGSTLSEISLTYLAALAARLETLDIEMTLLYVCHKRNGEIDPADRSYVEGKAAEVQRRLSEAQQKSDLHAGEKPIGVKGVLVEGHPAEAILSYAEDNSMDLIMMTTHGQSGLLRWAMGSVAYKVVHASNIPVWIIPSKDSTWSIIVTPRVSGNFQTFNRIAFFTTITPSLFYNLFYPFNTNNFH